MEDSDWTGLVSLGAIVVAGLSVFYGPRLSGRIAARQQIATTRLEVYAEAIDLMRARLFYVEDLASRAVNPYDGPSDEAGNTTAGRLLLVASEPVWKAFGRFFVLYNESSGRREAVELARSGGQANVEGQVALREAGVTMKQELDATIDRMAKDVGTRRKPLTT